MFNNVRFNQSFTCFTVAHSRGFRVYNSDPLQPWVTREQGDEKGCFAAALLGSSNILALVESEGPKQLPRSNITIWDDLHQKGHRIDFKSPVLNTLINHDVFIAVMENEVQVLAVLSNRVIAKFRTANNPNGVAALFDSTLVIPGQQVGEIVIIELDQDQRCIAHGAISCHRSAIQCISIGEKYIATASATGTLLRVQNRLNGEFKFYRRGLDRATIWSLAITSNKLAVLSDKGTIHIFYLGNSNDNQRHTLANIPLTPRYFGDEWSYTRCKTKAKTRGVIGWVTDYAFIIVRNDAQWEKYSLAGSELIMDGMRFIH